MMFFLFLDIVNDFLKIPAADRKRAIPGTPFKVILHIQVLIYKLR